MIKYKTPLLKSNYFLPYNTDLKERARELRKNMTKSEKKIWNEYFNKLDYMVARQKIIDHFIVDFYIAKLKLIIEIDGEIHKDLKYRDKDRDMILKRYNNNKIIRITNKNILLNPDKTYKKLDELLQKRKKELF